MRCLPTHLVLQGVQRVLQVGLQPGGLEAQLWWHRPQQAPVPAGQRVGRLRRLHQARPVLHQGGGTSRSRHIICGRRSKQALFLHLPWPAS